MHPGTNITGLSQDQLSDLLATAVSVSARSIRDAVRFLPADPSRVIVSGGGLRNLAIMNELKRLFAPCPVVGLGEVGGDDAGGLDPDAKEAVAFAVLADRAVAGAPGNVPAATGASGPVVLGKFSFGM